MYLNLTFQFGGCNLYSGATYIPVNTVSREGSNFYGKFLHEVKGDISEFLKPNISNISKEL